MSNIDNNDTDDDIKIDSVRNLLKFLSKTTYSSNLKIVPSYTLSPSKTQLP